VHSEWGPACAAPAQSCAGERPYSRGITSETCVSEIDKAVRHALQTGDILFVALVARGISAICGGSPQQIAEELTRAGIRAGVTMQFGRPD
jgi:hypothetical protein